MGFLESQIRRIINFRTFIVLVHIELEFHGFLVNWPDLGTTYPVNALVSWQKLMPPKNNQGRNAKVNCYLLCPIYYLCADGYFFRSKISINQKNNGCNSIYVITAMKWFFIFTRHMKYIKNGTTPFIFNKSLQYYN